MNKNKTVWLALLTMLLWGSLFPMVKLGFSAYEVNSTAAVWCLLTSDNYRDCVLKAVNLGDDTDTVAAIAGGLAGALYGYDAIPNSWLKALKRREYIEKKCRNLKDAWCGTEN